MSVFNHKRLGHQCSILVVRLEKEGSRGGNFWEVKHTVNKDWGRECEKDHWTEELGRILMLIHNAYLVRNRCQL